ncbi:MULTISPECIES: CPBP family intramembrane glutamic endopeptidase [unclassified Treponema]|uniref:CPBP family intramembrane glutamic endopeptidase n=1 Tax=unclassified Treponema TaxID=2638727 RepID=UPI0020A4BF45|nr:MULTISPECIES: CPBP family intramembrane glutamic endopeptidase [unclassified Treponema]UTC67614.1 CPBP family intramembrane metalloprotease [Treponema sp. OMZ 789]UTC70342.1 CPBP family intramembrane metalloprotease [Treponema sp. OMZ 790]UTC73056.1 CPBP family intramembrane metalloprotease [Treponema sp. OMZ 791]
MDKKNIKPIFEIAILYAVFLFFVYFVSKYAPYIAYYGFADPSNRSETYKSYAYLIMSISLCLILLLILCLCKLKLKNVIKFSKFNMRLIIKLLIFQYAFMFITAFISWNNLVSIFNAVKFWFEALQGKRIVMYQTLFKSQINIDLGVFFILYTIIVGPIVEELFFREIIYNKLKKILSIKFSVGITAVLYAFIHIKDFTINIDIVYLMFLGILLTYCYEKTESVWASISLHAIYNGFNTIIKCLKQDSAILLYLVIFTIAIIIMIIELIKHVKMRKTFNLVQSDSLSESEK